MTARTDIEYGAHFSGQVATEFSSEDFGELGAVASRKGFDQVWLNDNIGYRDVFLSLASMATKAPVSVGTSVLVPYLRNPLDVADVVATLAEVMDGDELTVGLGRGSPKLAGDLIESPRPYRMLREYTEFLRRMMDGETVRLGEYDLLTSYFNLEPDGEIRLEFDPGTPVTFVIGGHGPTAMEVGGKFMDGMIFAHSIPLHRSGKLDDLLATADAAAAEVDPDKELKRVASVSVSLGPDREAAREFPKPWIAQTLTGTVSSLLSDDELEALGVDLDALARLRSAREEGTNIQELTDLVTDDMIDATFVAGTREECAADLHQLIDELADSGVDQVAFLHLGPDYEDAMDVLAAEVLPN